MITSKKYPLPRKDGFKVKVRTKNFNESFIYWVNVIPDKKRMVCTKKTKESSDPAGLDKVFHDKKLTEGVKQHIRNKYFN